MNLKNGFAAASCWVLREQFSPADLLYSAMVCLAWSDFGFFSAEVALLIVVIFAFNYTFRKLTARMRIKYLLNALEKYCTIKHK